MARASISDAPRTPSSGLDPGMPHREETPRKSQDTWGDYVTRLAWECLGILPEELEEVPGEREVWASLLRQLPLRPSPGSAEENGWMDGWMGQFHLSSEMKHCGLRRLRS